MPPQKKHQQTDEQKQSKKRSKTHSLYSSGPPFIKRWRELAIGYITIRSLTQSRLRHYLDAEIEDLHCPVFDQITILSVH